MLRYFHMELTHSSAVDFDFALPQQGPHELSLFRAIYLAAPELCGTGLPCWWCLVSRWFSYSGRSSVSCSSTAPTVAVGLISATKSEPADWWLPRQVHPHLELAFAQPKALPSRLGCVGSFARGSLPWFLLPNLLLHYHHTIIDHFETMCSGLFFGLQFSCCLVRCT